MTERGVKLLAAGAFLVGVVCFVVGLVVEFTASHSVGSTIIFFGALLAFGARVMARRRGLPAP